MSSEPTVDAPLSRRRVLTGKLEPLRTRIDQFFDAGPTRQCIRRLLRAMDRHRAGRTANAMAFDLFLALIPMLALAGWALTHFVSAAPAALEASSLWANVTPEQLHGIIQAHFRSLSAATLAPVAAISGCWLASSAFHTMIGVFEEAFDCQRRPWWQSRLLAVGYAIVGMLVFILSAVLGAILTQPPGLLGEFVVQLQAFGLIRHVVTVAGVLGMTVFFAFLYRVAIRRPGIRRRIWPGAALAACVGGGASSLFGYYAPQVSRFALFYGGLAAVAILLLWLWVWCAAILLGAELNVLLENRDALRVAHRNGDP